MSFLYILKNFLEIGLVLSNLAITIESVVKMEVFGKEKVDKLYV